MNGQAQLSGEHWTRARTRQVRLWALTKGRSVDGEALAVLLTVKEECIDEPVDRWTLDGLADLMWTYIPQWCAVASVTRPKQLAESLWLYLAFLDASGELAPGSDELEALLASLVAYGGLDRFGRSRAGLRARTRRSPSPKARARQSAEADDLAPIIPLRPRPVHRPPLAAT